MCRNSLSECTRVFASLCRYVVYVRLSTLSASLIEVRKGLRGAGSNDEQADAILQANRDDDVSRIRGELMVLKWMVGVNIAMSVGVLLKLLA